MFKTHIDKAINRLDKKIGKCNRVTSKLQVRGRSNYSQFMSDRISKKEFEKRKTKLHLEYAQNDKNINALLNELDTLKLQKSKGVEYI